MNPPKPLSLFELLCDLDDYREKWKLRGLTPRQINWNLEKKQWETKTWDFEKPPLFKEMKEVGLNWREMLPPNKQTMLHALKNQT